MKKYTFKQHLTYWGEVEAETEDEAREIWERDLDEDPQLHFYESSEVELQDVEDEEEDEDDSE